MPMYSYTAKNVYGKGISGNVDARTKIRLQAFIEMIDIARH